MYEHSQAHYCILLLAINLKTSSQKTKSVHNVCTLTRAWGRLSLIRNLDLDVGQFVGRLISARTANEGPVRIQYKCLVHIYVFQKMNINIIIVFWLPVPTLIYLWEVYILYFQDQSAYSAAEKYVDRSWEYINRSQTYECGNLDWGRAIPRKGIHKWDFPCSAMPPRQPVLHPPSLISLVHILPTDRK
jgi:hypothetical protein